MSQGPRVSVLMPMRDAAATVGAALRSVGRQSEGDLECVVVDDGSRDGSAELVRREARRDPRLRLLPAPREGLVPALTRGLLACRGTFVARMDADDVMHRHRLALQLAALDAHPEWAGVGCHVRLFPRAPLGAGMRAYERWLRSIDGPEAVRREAFVECPLPHPSLVLRRELLLRHGFRDVGWPEDYDLLLRLLAAGETLGVVPRRLLAWRDGPARLSRTDPRYGRDRFTACKAAFLAQGPLRDAPSYVLWGYGGTGRALCAALSSRGRRPSLIVELHPGRLGNRIQGAPVVPPEALRTGAPGPILVSVAGAGPRAEIRRALRDMGHREGRDFWCAA